jgi:GxxExxY protein
MPEKFYERLMAKRLPQIKKQPHIIIKNDYVHSYVRPDAILNNIIIEYKAKNKNKNYEYQVRKYLRYCDCVVVLLLNFNTKEFDIYY